MIGKGGFRYKSRIAIPLLDGGQERVAHWGEVGAGIHQLIQLDGDTATRTHLHTVFGWLCTAEAEVSSLHELSWGVQPKFTLWPLTENVCRPLV